MNCRRTRSLLSAYLDAELTGYEMLEIRDHISRCQDCSTEHKSLVSLKQLLSALPDQEPRPEFIFHLQNLSPRRSFDELILRYAPLSLLNGTWASVMLPASGRRLASAFVFSMLGIWFIVAPAARAPHPMSMMALAPSRSSRLLDMVRFSGPYSFSGWRNSATDPPIVDPMGRPVALEDARMESFEAQMLAETRSNTLTMMIKPYSESAVAPEVNSRGFGVSDLVYTGYSVPSR